MFSSHKIQQVFSENVSDGMFPEMFFFGQLHASN